MSKKIRKQIQKNPVVVHNKKTNLKAKNLDIKFIDAHKRINSQRAYYIQRPTC